MSREVADDDWVVFARAKAAKAAKALWLVEHSNT